MRKGLWRLREHHFHQIAVIVSAHLLGDENSAPFEHAVQLWRIEVTVPIDDYIKDGGIFLSSGIITERKEDVLAALEAGNFKVEAVREKKGWVAIASRYMG